VKDDADLKKTLDTNKERILTAQSLSEVTGMEFRPVGRNPAPKPYGDAKNVRGFYKAYGIAGVGLNIAQAPSYIREYGWLQGSWEMFKDGIDPFGITDPPPTPVV
jgi:hypothetical protein